MWTWWLAWRWPRQMMADVELGNPTNSTSQSTGEGRRDDLTWRMRWTKNGKIRQLLIWIMILPLNMGVWSVTKSGAVPIYGCLVGFWHCSPALFWQVQFLSWFKPFQSHREERISIRIGFLRLKYVRMLFHDSFSTATNASSFEDFQLHTQLQIISISWNTWILDYLTVFVWFCIHSWYPKQPFFNGCFNWMIPNLYIHGKWLFHQTSIKRLLFGALGLNVLDRGF